MHVVDVMNPKSDAIMRHPVNAYDTKKLSKWYAVESRIHTMMDNGEITDCWFTNEMVFDIDPSPNMSDNEAYDAMQKSLDELRNILGEPWILIRNKNLYTQWEKSTYFTKNGICTLPKKYGCQVIYKLSKPLYSQYVERVNLYHKLRLHIARIAGADTGFRGHMHKNPWNHDLFNVCVSNNFRPINLETKAKEFLDPDLVDLIWDLSAFETLEQNDHPYLLQLSNRLAAWYNDLNQWAIPGKKKQKSANRIHSVDVSKYNGRNERLFHWLSAQSIKTLENLDLQELVKNPFMHAGTLANAPLPINEAKSTYESVLAYKRKHGDVAAEIEIPDGPDRRVLKIDQKPRDLNWAESVLPSIKAEMRESEDERESVAHSISAAIMKSCSVEFLSNIQSVVTDPFISFVRNAMLDYDYNSSLGIWDVYKTIQAIVYDVHFAYYAKISKNRKNSASITSDAQSVRPPIAKSGASLTNCRIKWLVPYAKSFDEKHFVTHALKLSKIMVELRDAGHLNDDLSPKPISYYQVEFHVRNADASLYVKLLKVAACIYRSMIDINYSTGSINQYQNHSRYYRLIKSVKRVFKINSNIIFIIFVTPNIISTINALKDNKSFPEITTFNGGYIMNYFVFDVETTGFNPQKDPILSIGSILWNDTTDKTAEFYRLFNWKEYGKVDIPDNIVELTGITQEMIETSEQSLSPEHVICQMYDVIRDFCSENGGILDALVAFNSPFDINMMRADTQTIFDAQELYNPKIDQIRKIFDKSCGEQCPMFIDSLTIDRIFHYEEDGERVTHNLEDVGSRYGLDPNEHAHNAMYDTKRLLSVFKMQLKELESKGIALDEEFEKRLERKFKREEAKFGNRRSMDYFAMNCAPLAIG